MTYVPPANEKKAARQDRILHEIQIERRRQDRQWGGDAHDDKHSIEDFCDFIGNQIWKMRGVQDHPRERLVKVAALAMAAVEMIDRGIAKEQA